MRGESDEVFGNAVAFQREMAGVRAASRLEIGGATSYAEAEGRGSVGDVHGAEETTRTLRSGHGQGLLRCGIRGGTVW